MQRYGVDLIFCRSNSGVLLVVPNLYRQVFLDDFLFSLVSGHFGAKWYVFCYLGIFGSLIYCCLASMLWLIIPLIRETIPLLSLSLIYCSHYLFQKASLSREVFTLLWTCFFIISIKFFFTYIDRLAKYCRLISSFVEEGALSAFSVAKLFFDSIVRFLGILVEVISDGDPRFVVCYQQVLWALLGTKLLIVLPIILRQMGRQRGLTGPWSRSYACLLSEGGLDRSQWYTLLPQVGFVLKSQASSSIQFFPAELNLGQKLVNTIFKGLPLQWVYISRQR